MSNNSLPSIGYALTTACAIVLLHVVMANISPIFLVMMSALCAVVFFHVIHRRSLVKLYKQVYAALLPVLWINVLIAAQWLGTFYAAKTALPFQFLIIAFLVPVLLSNLALSRKQTLHRFYALLNVVMVMAMLLTMRTWQGCVLSLVVGVLSYVYRKYTHDLCHDGRFSKMDILCVRNTGLLIVSAILFFCHAHLNLAALPWWPWWIIIPVITFILPIYLNQSGIQQMGPEHHSIVVSTTPMLALVISLFMGIAHLHFTFIVLSAVVALFLVVQTIWR